LVIGYWLLVIGYWLLVIRHGHHPPRRAGFDQDGFVLWRIRYQGFTEDNGANEVLEARKRKFLVTLVSFC
jgi:hypothetical protein